jgi:hypothetical protein
MLKFGVGWTIPTTPLQLLALEFPGLGVNCQPLGDCLARIMTAGKGILKVRDQNNYFAWGVTCTANMWYCGNVLVLEY